MTIFDDNFLMTIFDDIETIFDNWKDSPGDLTFETLITILTIENLNSDNHSYLTINCDTGQHSQFLRCFIPCPWNTNLTPFDYSQTGQVFPFSGFLRLHESLIVLDIPHLPTLGVEQNQEQRFPVNAGSR